MDDYAMISQTIQFVDNVDPVADENSALRLRYAAYLQEVISEVWLAHAWRWRQTDAALAAIDAKGNAALPTDYMEVGRDGGLYDYVGTKFDEQPIQILKSMLQDSGGALRTSIYSISDKVWVPRGWQGTVLRLFYDTVAPTVVDTSGIDTYGLKKLPAYYQVTIINPYMRMRGFEDKGDPRFGFWNTKYEKNMARATISERPGKDSVHRMSGSGMLDMC